MSETEVTPLMNAEQVANILGIATKTVHRLVRERKLACVQVTARERRFTPAQVNDYVELRSTKTHVDKKDSRPVSSRPKKGGAKSTGVSGTGLAKEIRSLCLS
jgi:excisionase family DNA binding protein